MGNGKICLLDLLDGKYPKVISVMFIASNACSEKDLPVVFFTIWFAVAEIADWTTDVVVKPEVAGPINAKGTM